MNKLKELWQYAVFRWCVYQTPLLVFGLLLRNGAFCDLYHTGIRYVLYKSDLKDYAILIWILILTPPAVWVWRKQVWKVIGFLNKKAEED